MFALLKKKNFSLLWLAGLISMIGNWMLFAALPFHIYSVTNSALATSAMMMVFVAPGVLFGSIAGVFVDRWNRKRIMIAISLLQAGTVIFMMFAQTREMIWIAYVALFIEASLAKFFSPAENALLPKLVGKEHLLAANSLNALNDNLGRIIGPAIGGTLLALLGFTSVVFFDAATYLLAAVLIMFVSVDGAPEKSSEEEKAPADVSPWKAVWQEWRQGLVYVGQKRVLLNAFVIAGVAMFGDSILSAVLVVFVQADLGFDAAQFGWIMTTRGLGGIVGGLMIAQIAARLNTRTLISGGLMVTAALLLVIINLTDMTYILITMLAIGIPLMAWMVSLQTIFQEETEDALRGRVFGTFGATSTLLMFVGSALAGVLADAVGAFPLLITAGLLYFAAGVVAHQLMKPKVQESKLSVEAAV